MCMITTNTITHRSRNIFRENAVDCELITGTLRVTDGGTQKLTASTVEGSKVT